MIDHHPSSVSLKTAPNGVVILESEGLSNPDGPAVPHAFTTRRGGVSDGDFATLDLNCAGDGGLSDKPREDVAANYQRALTAIGCGNRTAVWINQVHGNSVIEVDLRGRAKETPRTSAPVQPLRCGQGDALITTDPGVVLTVRVADCVPILLASSDGSVVAAIHAGWRGIVADVVGQTIKVLLDRYEVSPSELHAAVGPAISAKMFEVGPEVADEFDEVGLGECVLRTPSAKPHIDLEKAVALQLARFIPPTQTDLSKTCTYGSPGLLYSHRRDLGRTGRQAAMIGVRG